MTGRLKFPKALPKQFCAFDFKVLVLGCVLMSGLPGVRALFIEHDGEQTRITSAWSLQTSKSNLWSFLLRFRHFSYKHHVLSKSCSCARRSATATRVSAHAAGAIPISPTKVG